MFMRRFTFGVLAVLIPLVAAGCGTSGPVAPEGPVEEDAPGDLPSEQTEGPRYYVWGLDLSAVDQNIRVEREDGTAPVATVTVNGEPIPEREPGSGIFSGRLAERVVAGAALHVEVVADGDTILVDAIVPEAPLIVEPADEAVVSLGDSIHVVWESDSDPLRFQVNGSFSISPTSGGSKRWDAGASARDLWLPADSFSTGEVDVRVYAYNHGAFTGPVIEGSRVHVRAARGPLPTVTIVPR
jgi:hypothetical protein